MRLPEIFGLLTFPVFRTLRSFNSQNCFEIYRVFGPPKLLQNLLKILLKHHNRKEYVCQKCQKYAGIFGNMSKILNIDCELDSI